jgi:hypothetical protein
MSGAVDFVKNIAEVGAFPMVAPVKAAVDLIGEGKNPLRSIGESAKKAVQTTGQILQPGLEGAGLASDPPPLSIVADDPAAVADDAEKKKARAKRQAEIDIMTGQPGRGGTILTDQYTYQV